MQLAGCLKGNGAYTKNTQNLPRCPMTSEIKKHQSSEDATAQRRRAPKLGGGGAGKGQPSPQQISLSRSGLRYFDGETVREFKETNAPGRGAAAARPSPGSPALSPRGSLRSWPATQPSRDPSSAFAPLRPPPATAAPPAQPSDGGSRRSCGAPGGGGPAPRGAEAMGPRRAESWWRRALAHLSALRPTAHGRQPAARPEGKGETKRGHPSALRRAVSATAPPRSRPPSAAGVPTP